MGVAGEVFAGAAAGAAVGSAVVAAAAAWLARRSSKEAVASTDSNAALGRAMTRYVAAITNLASTDERVALVGYTELELIAADPSAGEFRDAAKRMLAAELVNASQRAELIYRDRGAVDVQSVHEPD